MIKQIGGAALLVVAAAMAVLSDGMLLPFALPVGLFGLMLMGVPVK